MHTMSTLRHNTQQRESTGADKAPVKQGEGDGAPKRWSVDGVSERAEESGRGRERSTHNMLLSVSPGLMRGFGTLAKCTTNIRPLVLSDVGSARCVHVIAQHLNVLS